MISRTSWLKSSKLRWPSPEAIIPRFRIRLFRIRHFRHRLLWLRYVPRPTRPVHRHRQKISAHPELPKDSHSRNHPKKHINNNRFEGGKKLVSNCMHTPWQRHHNLILRSQRNSKNSLLQALSRFNRENQKIVIMRRIKTSRLIMLTRKMKMMIRW